MFCIRVQMGGKKFLKACTERFEYKDRLLNFFLVV